MPLPPRLLLLLLFCVCASAQDGEGFRSLRLFVGRRSTTAAAQGSPPDRECKRTGSCDTPGTWHAQALQDKAIIKAVLPDKRDGYFVDLAANHPIIKSNTRSLERDYGWRGLCIDGNEEFLMLLLKRRTCQVVGAIVSSDADADVQYRRWHGSGGTGGSTGTWQHALSGIVGFDNKNSTNDDKWQKYAGKSKAGAAGFHDTKGVTARLDDVLRFHNAPNVIDYLSLDVEGAEEAVLRSFAFDRYTFLAVTIERPTEALMANIAAHGYTFVAEMPGGFGEKLFVHSTIPGGPAVVGARVKEFLQQHLAKGWKKTG